MSDQLAILIYELKKELIQDIKEGIRMGNLRNTL